MLCHLRRRSVYKYKQQESSSRKEGDGAGIRFVELVHMQNRQEKEKYQSGRRFRSLNVSLAFYSQ